MMGIQGKRIEIPKTVIISLGFYNNSLFLPEIIKSVTRDSQGWLL